MPKKGTSSLKQKKRTAEFHIFQSVYNNSQNIWDKLQFSCEIAHYEQNLISVFQDLFAGINKTFILVGGLGTRLSFYEV